MTIFRLLLTSVRRILSLCRMLFGIYSPKFPTTMRQYLASFAALFGPPRGPIALILSAVIVFYIVLDIVGEIPTAIHVDLVMVSATLGGLVLASALFKYTADETQRSLIQVARWFILSTLLFLIFNFFFGLANAIDVDPTSFEFSRVGFGRAIIYWVSVAGIYAGAFTFASGFIDLLLVLRHIAKPKGHKETEDNNSHPIGPDECSPE